jgi:hypothetical protein
VELGEILRVMRSRWYIVVPMLVLAVGLGVGAFLMVPTTYTTYTMVSLLSSPASTTTALQGQDNPFLNFNSSLVATADFLGRRLQSTDVAQELKRSGVSEKYTVTLAENAQGPFLTLTVTGDDKAHILQSAATISRYADFMLVQIQQQNGVADRDMIRLTQIIPPQKPAAEMKKKLEAVIVAGGGTVALTFIVTFIVESVSRGRRRRQEDYTPATGSAVAGAAPGDAKDGSRTPATSATAPVGPTPVPPPRPLVVIKGSVKSGADETKVLQLNHKSDEKAADGKPVPGEKTAVIPVSSRGDRSQPPANPPVPQPRQPAGPAAESASRGKAVVSPPPGTARVTSPATYQSRNADRRGQDANHVNGS